MCDCCGTKITGFVGRINRLKGRSTWFNNTDSSNKYPLDICKKCYNRILMTVRAFIKEHEDGEL
jgi:hypothetical protein